MRLKYERHQKGENDRRRDARTRRRKWACERLKEALARALHRPVCKQISEPRNGDGRPCARKIDDRLIQPERRERYPREHEDDKDLPRREVGKIYDELGDRTDEPADRERLQKHQ